MEFRVDPEALFSSWKRGLEIPFNLVPLCPYVLFCFFFLFENLKKKFEAASQVAQAGLELTV